MRRARRPGEIWTGRSALIRCVPGTARATCADEASMVSVSAYSRLASGALHSRRCPGRTRRVKEIRNARGRHLEPREPIPPWGRGRPHRHSGIPDQAPRPRKRDQPTSPDVLAVQDVGEPNALKDLVGLLNGKWTLKTSTVFEAHHAIRVGVISQLRMSKVQHVSQFPAPLGPVQVDDTSATMNAMGRGALRVRVTARRTTHRRGGMPPEVKTALVRRRFPTQRRGRTSPLCGLRARPTRGRSRDSALMRDRTP
jgi:hypothetical protein